MNILMIRKLLLFSFLSMVIISPMPGVDNCSIKNNKYFVSGIAATIASYNFYKFFYHVNRLKNTYLNFEDVDFVNRSNESRKNHYYTNNKLLRYKMYKKISADFIMGIFAVSVAIAYWKRS